MFKNSKGVWHFLLCHIFLSILHHYTFALCYRKEYRLKAHLALSYHHTTEGRETDQHSTTLLEDLTHSQHQLPPGLNFLPVQMKRPMMIGGTPMMRGGTLTMTQQINKAQDTIHLNQRDMIPSNRWQRSKRYLHYNYIRGVRAVMGNMKYSLPNFFFKARFLSTFQ